MRVHIYEFLFATRIILRTNTNKREKMTYYKKMISFNSSFQRIRIDFALGAGSSHRTTRQKSIMVDRISNKSRTIEAPVEC